MDKYGLTLKVNGENTVAFRAFTLFSDVEIGATKQRQEKRGEDRKKSTGCRGMASASGDRLGSYIQHIQVSSESMHKF